ncbi:hypothetical protein [Photorhabdus bodei]|uniref:Transposase n=1 Tax=Photorhabdus bodei TaxID=2029681 RepID=A0ABX0APV1_9GAMM|nr:hypothetical protein [Photorhabdus bodei]NDK99112.1 hypothetical protein [Photorhabdus bodei]NDL03456.1 hypothetical protein [Photorhabdus bodei]NDL07570.1 hypothetical protein [Photorhabdus bodei]
MTGVSECSQQRGNLKDNGYMTLAKTGITINNKIERSHEKTIEPFNPNDLLLRINILKEKKC